MHVKTNIEHSSVQIIILAMCPLITVMTSLKESLFFLSGIVLCLIVSQIFILMFNRYLTNDVKTLLTALISAVIVVIASIGFKEIYNIILPTNTYFVVFSTTILSAEFIYFRNKATTTHYFMSIMKFVLIFTILMVLYSVIKEFLTFGAIYEKQIFKFSGFDFCKTIIFDLILLASICVVADYIVRTIDKKHEIKMMVYQKYLKIVRNEKIFQYDSLRRDKLLTNKIEINKINKNDAEKIIQKEDENEAIESVEDVVSEDAENKEDKDLEDKVEDEIKRDDNESSKPKKKSKKNKKEGKK